MCITKWYFVWFFFKLAEVAEMAILFHLIFLIFVLKLWDKRFVKTKILNELELVNKECVFYNMPMIRGLSQNSVDWVYNFWSVQCILITFLHSVNCIIFYHNPKFQVCIMLAFWKKIIIFKIKIWTAEHHLTSKCVTLI